MAIDLAYQLTSRSGVALMRCMVGFAPSYAHTQFRHQSICRRWPLWVTLRAALFTVPPALLHKPCPTTASYKLCLFPNLRAFSRRVSQFEPRVPHMSETLAVSVPQATPITNTSATTGPQPHAMAHAVACAMVTVALFVLVGLLTGRIPVAGGAGWDGAVYLHYVQAIATGSSVDLNPYRLSRIPGFLPAMIAAYGGMRGESLLQFQSIINVLLLAGSAGLFLHLLMGWGLSARVAWLATACLGLSWPWLIMPVFYPMLSDHLALVVAVLALWSWDRHRTGQLALLALASVWIMPGLFLVPLLLASVPKNPCHPGALPATLSPAIGRVLKVLIALPLLAVGYMSLRIEDAAIIAHPGGAGMGWLSLKYFSLACLLLSVAVVWYVWSRLLTGRQFWSRLSLRGMAWAALATAGSFALLVLMADWDRGYRGPPLFHYLLVQSLAAPAKPLVAHFLYFGPVFLLAIASVVRWAHAACEKAETHLYGLAVVIIAFLPLLLLGSESRQWIALFPLCVAWLAMHLRSERRLLPFALMTMVLLVPAVVLKSTLARAVSDGLPISHSDWQVYFGRQGPWMSSDTYLVGLALFGCFVLAWLAINRQWRSCK